MGVKIYNPVDLAEIDDFKAQFYGKGGSSPALEKRVKELEDELADYKEKQDAIDKDLDVLAGGIDE